MFEIFLKAAAVSSILIDAILSSGAITISGREKGTSSFEAAAFTGTVTEKICQPTKKKISAFIYHSTNEEVQSQ